MHLLDILRSAAALVAGGLIGLSFGWLQDLALRRHQKREQSGNFNNGWAVMPGSMRRVAYLLVALALGLDGVPARAAPARAPPRRRRELRGSSI
jgi:hypothetical protein